MRRWICFGLLLSLLLAAIPVQAASLSLSWDAPTTNTDGTPLTDLASYNLYECQGSACTPSFKRNVGNVTSTTESGLPSNTLMRYQVTALDTFGNESARSNLAEATTVADPLPPPSGLDDTGLVVRYYLDEAASGQGVTAVQDAAPAPVNLPLSYVGSNPAYTELSTGRGLTWSAIEQPGHAGILIDGTKIKTSLQGMTAATIELVATVQNASENNSRLVTIGLGSESGQLTLSAYPTSQMLKFFWQGETLAGEWDNGYVTSRAVYHLVLNTTLATAANRVRLYRNGVLVAKSAGTNPSENQTIDLATGRYLTLGNRQGSGESFRSMQGQLWYVSYYAAAFSQARVDQHVSVLSANDDTPAAGSPPAGATGLTLNVSVQ